MAISSSNSYAASFSGKPAPKAAQPQFGGEVFSHEAKNLSGNFIDSFAKIFTGKKVKDATDPKNIIHEDLYSAKEQWGLGSLFALFSAVVPTASIFTFKGISHLFTKASNAIFNRASKVKVEHAKTHRY